jgi:predicted lipoprotein
VAIPSIEIMSSASPDSPRTSSALPWRWLALALGAVVLLVVFPPFRFVRLGPDGRPVATATTATPEVFDPVAFTGSFWTERLQPAATQAPALAPIVLAVRADPVAAAKQHGHKVGVGTTWYFFARGTGRVAAVERSRLLVEVDGAPGVIVAVRTGPVFGNAVRDGCRLLELNTVPGLAEFNAVSAELNRMIEQSVQPPLRTGIEVGTRLSFTGCAEAPESVDSGPLLVFVPVQAEVIR